MIFMDENNNNVSHRVALKKKYVAQGGVCALCARRMPPLGDVVDNPHDVADLDHIIPVANGGRDLMSNLQATHKRCNNAKGAGD